MTLYVEDTIQVKKDADSGIAAIVHELAIARGGDTQTINFYYKLLRRNLANCLTKSSFNAITFKNSPRIGYRRKFQINVHLYCHCNTPDMGDPMTKCGDCGKWFHMKCETGNQFRLVEVWNLFQERVAGRLAKKHRGGN